MKKILFLFIIIFNYQISYAENKIAYIDIDFILNKISFSCIFIDENSEVSKELKSNSGFLELPIVFKRNSSFHKNFIESGEVVGGCYGLLKSIEKGYHKVKNGER